MEFLPKYAHILRATGIFFTCAVLAQMAHASGGAPPSDYIVHAMGNVEQLEGIFQGIVHIIDSAGFRTAVAATMAIALLMQSFAAQFTNAKVSLADLIGDKVKSLMIPIVLTATMFAGPRATVTILDPYWGHSSGLIVPIVAPRRVEGVPMGFAIFANFFSVTRTHIQSTFDEAFAQPDDLRYSRTGMLFGNKVMTNLASIQLNNPHLRADLIAYMRNCYFYDVYQGRISSDAVRAPDIWKGMTYGVTLTESSTTGRKTFTYGNQIATNPNRLTQVIYDKQYQRPSTAPNTETTATVGCTEAVPAISNKLTKYALYENESWVRRLMRGTMTSGSTDGGKAAFATAVGGILPTFMGASTYSVADHVRQAAMTNLVKESGGDLGTILSNPAIVQQATAQAQSEIAVKANYVQTARLAEMALPLIRNGLEAVAYGCFPLVILVALAYGTGAIPVLKSYAIGLGTLQIWGPLYSIVNMLGTDYSKRKILNMMGGQPSFTLENITLISNDVSSDMAVMGYMVLLVPVIAGMLIKAGMDGMSGMASQMMSPATGTAASGMAQNAALGNYSWDNLSQGNTTAHNFSAFNSAFNNTAANKYSTDTQLSNSARQVHMADPYGANVYGENGTRRRIENANVLPYELKLSQNDAAKSETVAEKWGQEAKETAALTQQIAKSAQSHQNEFLKTTGQGLDNLSKTNTKDWYETLEYTDESGKKTNLNDLSWAKDGKVQTAVEWLRTNWNREDGFDKLNSLTAPEELESLFNHNLAKGAASTIASIGGPSPMNAAATNPRIGGGTALKMENSSPYTAVAAIAGTALGNVADHKKEVWTKFFARLSSSDKTSDLQTLGVHKTDGTKIEDTDGTGKREQNGKQESKEDSYSELNRKRHEEQHKYNELKSLENTSSLATKNAYAQFTQAKENATYTKTSSATENYDALKDNRMLDRMFVHQAYQQEHPGSAATSEQESAWYNTTGNLGANKVNQVRNDFWNDDKTSKESRISQVRGYLTNEEPENALEHINATRTHTQNELNRLNQPTNADNYRTSLEKQHKDQALTIGVKKVIEDEGEPLKKEVQGIARKADINLKAGEGENSDRLNKIDSEEKRIQNNKSKMDSERKDEGEKIINTTISNDSKQLQNSIEAHFPLDTELQTTKEVTSSSPENLKYDFAERQKSRAKELNLTLDQLKEKDFEDSQAILRSRQHTGTRYDPIVGTTLPYSISKPVSQYQADVARADDLLNKHDLEELRGQKSKETIATDINTSTPVSTKQDNSLKKKVASERNVNHGPSPDEPELPALNPEDVLAQTEPKQNSSKPAQGAPKTKPAQGAPKTKPAQGAPKTKPNTDNTPNEGSPFAPPSAVTNRHPELDASSSSRLPELDTRPAHSLPGMPPPFKKTWGGDSVDGMDSMGGEDAQPIPQLPGRPLTPIEGPSVGLDEKLSTSVHDLKISAPQQKAMQLAGMIQEDKFNHSPSMFADSGHGNINTPRALRDPVVLAAMKEAGMAAMFVEYPVDQPEVRQLFADFNGNASPDTDAKIEKYLNSTTGSSPTEAREWLQTFKAWRDIGVSAIPYDASLTERQYSRLNKLKLNSPEAQVVLQESIVARNTEMAGNIHDASKHFSSNQTYGVIAGQLHFQGEDNLLEKLQTSGDANSNSRPVQIGPNSKHLGLTDFDRKVELPESVPSLSMSTDFVRPLYLSLMERDLKGAASDFFDTYKKFNGSEFEFLSEIKNQEDIKIILNNTIDNIIQKTESFNTDYIAEKERAGAVKEFLMAHSDQFIINEAKNSGIQFEKSDFNTQIQSKQARASNIIKAHTEHISK